MYAFPAIGGDGTIYVGSSDHALYAINPDGSLKWTYTTGDTIFDSPAVGGDGTIYIGSSGHTLYAINPDGSLKWSYSEGGGLFQTPIVAADGIVYVGRSDRSLYAFNPDGSPGLPWDRYFLHANFDRFTPGGVGSLA